MRVAATGQARPHILRHENESSGRESGGEHLQENEMNQREAEEKKRRQQARTQHDKDLAILSANRKVTVANAK